MTAPDHALRQAKKSLHQRGHPNMRSRGARLVPGERHRLHLRGGDNQHAAQTRGNCRGQHDPALREGEDEDQGPALQGIPYTASRHVATGDVGAPFETPRPQPANPALHTISAAAEKRRGGSPCASFCKNPTVRRNGQLIRLRCIKAARRRGRKVTSLVCDGRKRNR